MTLEKRRLRDLQRVDALGATYDRGNYSVGGERAHWIPYEWLWGAGYLTLDGGRLILTEKGERTVSEPVEREWLLNVGVVAPKTPTVRLPENARSDVYAYERALGRVTPHEHGDDELFLEDVHRLAAVRRHVDEDRIWLRTPERVFNLASGEEFTGDLSTLFRWGPLSRAEESRAPIETEVAAADYHRYPFFHRHAGRKTALADATTESLLAAIEEVAPASGKVVVKVTRRKYAVVTLDVTDGARDALYDSDALMGSLMHLEGDRDAYLVQEHVDMTFERRVFVVDHHTVESAGCVEEYHPYSRVTASDPRMRRRRRRGGTDPDVIWAEEQTKRLMNFAREVAREVKQSPWRRKLTEYVLDVALGPDGEPLIVELNGIRNCGLYASDHGHVVRTLTMRADIWGKAPHARPRATVEHGQGEEGR